MIAIFWLLGPKFGYFISRQPPSCKLQDITSKIKDETNNEFGLISGIEPLRASADPMLVPPLPHPSPLAPSLHPDSLFRHFPDHRQGARPPGRLQAPWPHRKHQLKIPAPERARGAEPVPGTRSAPSWQGDAMSSWH